MSSAQNSERLSFPRLIAFAAPAGSVGAIFIPMSLFLPPLYSELGIGLATVGMIFLIAKVWDGVTDPVLGILADRHGTRFGRRRPWIIASVPILAVSIHRLFIPPPDPGAVFQCWSSPPRWKLATFRGRLRTASGNWASSSWFPYLCS
jgi:Na+/melibiose symporter-like transporter